MTSRRASSIRHQAPTPAANLVTRPRLIRLLRRRFEERLTIVTAGAGFGKTTLLAQAVQENRLEQFGQDYWLRAGALDQDPERLLVGLFQSITGLPGRPSVTTDDIAELVWMRSPDSVALIIDELHVLDDATETWQTITRLADELPDNAHLVLSGRSTPNIGVERRQLHDDIVLVTETSLEFDDNEIAQLGFTDSAMFPSNDPVLRWPALAVLSHTLGRDASAEFMREEVVATLHPERARLLGLLTPFGAIDDVLVGAVGGTSAWSAKMVLGGLPLVERFDNDRYEMHPLWVDALAGLIDRDEWEDSLRWGARRLLEHGEYLRAAKAAAAAHDLDCLDVAVQHYCRQPLLSIDSGEVLELQAMLPASHGVGPTGLVLDGVRQLASSEHLAAAIFERAAEAARSVGDLGVEALAHWRLAHLHYLHDHSRLVVDEHLSELVRAKVPLAQATEAFIDSVTAQIAGNVDEAMAATKTLAVLDPEQRRVTIAERLVDLGHPEQVVASLESVVGADHIDVFGAQAFWLRGEIDPNVAWELASDFPGIVGRRGMAHEIVSVQGVVATVAVAAGAFDEARRLVRDARRSRTSVGDHVNLLVDVAEVLVTLCTEGEDTARQLLREVLERIPLGRWPARGYLHGLAALRALIPETGPILDSCTLGPALRTAVEAGAAIEALRMNADPGPARALPWHEPNLLRAHVPPPLLTELAVPLAADDRRVRQLLIDTPGVGDWLERIIENAEKPVATQAAGLLAELPIAPPYRLQVRTLGELCVTRSDGGELGRHWHRRQRVQDLFVYLLTHPNVSRRAAAGALWPGLPDTKAAANLRVNLTHLLSALEPERTAGSRAFFVAATSTNLRLAIDTIDLDVDRFDRLVEQAATAEADGVPSLAVEAYAAATDLYTGDYLEHIDDDWVTPERLRLRSLVHAAACRHGELVLASGEPEQAMTSAVRALQLDSLSERAHRLFIRCHLALGSDSAARSACRSLSERLESHGLTPDEETRQLLARLEGS